MIDQYYLKGLEARIEKLENAMTQKTNKDDFDFSVGQTVYFFHTEYGRTCWGEDNTIVYPTELELLQGRICDINQNMDYVTIEVKGDSELIRIGYTYFHDWVFKSKEDAIDALLGKLNDMRVNND